METKLRHVRKMWEAKHKGRSLNVFDKNGNTMLSMGDIIIQDEAVILASLLEKEEKRAFTTFLFNQNFICVKYGRGILVGGGGFNAIQENDRAAGDSRSDNVANDNENDGMHSIDGKDKRNDSSKSKNNTEAIVDGECKGKEFRRRLKHGENVDKNEPNGEAIIDNDKAVESARIEEQKNNDTGGTQQNDEEMYKSSLSATHSNSSIDIICAGSVHDLIVVVNGRSSDKESLVGLLKVILRLMKSSELPLF